MGWCFVESATSTRSYSHHAGIAYRAPKGLTDVAIPEGESVLDSESFKDCKELVSVTIPKTVSHIIDNPFMDCPNLVSIVVAKGNRKFDSRGGCNAIIEKERDGLIAGCMNTVIPESVQRIFDRAFSGCVGLKTIAIPKSVSQIDEYAFSGCIGLISIEIPGSVRFIGKGAFHGCTSLTSIVLHEGIKVIDYSTFSGCSSLSSVIIPESVTAMGTNGLTSSMTIFDHCPGLRSIKVLETNTKFDSREDCNAVIEKQEDYLLVGCINTIIPDTVKSIGPSAFEGCSELKSIVIPNSVKNIGKRAFKDCVGLTNISLPDSVEWIDSNAFEGCTSLKSIVIPSSVNSIGSSAFKDCTGLTSIILLNSLSLYDEVFRGCVGLTKVVLPPSCNIIGRGVFFGCNNISYIESPKNINTIWTKGFKSVADFLFGSRSSEMGFTTEEREDRFIIKRSSEQTSIGAELLRPIYEGFVNTHLFTWGESTITKIYGYRSISSIIIPEIVECIGYQAFSSFRNLKVVCLPSHLQEIGDYAFRWCDSLTEIYLPDSIKTMGVGVFACCSNLKAIYVPKHTFNYFKKLLSKKLWPLIVEQENDSTISI